MAIGNLPALGNRVSLGQDFEEVIEVPACFCAWL